MWIPGPSTTLQSHHLEHVASKIVREERECRSCVGDVYGLDLDVAHTPLARIVSFLKMHSGLSVHLEGKV